MHPCSREDSNFRRRAALRSVAKRLGMLGHSTAARKQSEKVHLYLLTTRFHPSGVHLQLYSSVDVGGSKRCGHYS